MEEKPMDATVDGQSQAKAPNVNTRTETTTSQVPRGRFVHNTWYVAMFSSDLAAGQLLHRTILNEPIVFFRKEDGSVAAITDRCSTACSASIMGWNLTRMENVSAIRMEMALFPARHISKAILSSSDTR
jgi:hypothetical protein